MPVPPIRIRLLNQASTNPDGQFVLYWMVANRRLTDNFSLDRAIEWCRKLRLPLVILEALRCDYPWASDRLHRFVLQGMIDHATALQETDVTYHAFVETERKQGSGLLVSLARHASIIVTDDFPCFFIPEMLAAASQKVNIKCEAVDSNGLFPMRAADKVFSTAHSFRRFLQKELFFHLGEFPLPDPFAKANFVSKAEIPKSILSRWPDQSLESLKASLGQLARFPVNHRVTPANFDGGSKAALNQMQLFFEHRLKHYAEGRNHPDQNVSSELSAYLHFGHISAHRIFREVAQRESWSLDRIEGRKATGSRADWWQMSEPSEGYLDELITWRELGYNMCWQREDYDQYSSLPDWARKTLEDHQQDIREHQYSLEQFESAATHDPVWNAAQNQLIREGRLHNYLRMLWGKKILEWSGSPQAALETMIELNNKYALDGRNPNSYSGIFWCLGRYDRAWGPERKIFGKVRFMSSENTLRKLKMKNYLETYSSKT